MGIPLNKYKKIKDKCCLIYLGHAEEYLIQIKHLIPYIKKEFPELEIHICCNQKFTRLFDKSFSQEQLREKKPEFGHSIEIKSNLSIHPILKFLNDSNIPYGPAQIPERLSPTVKCAICPKGSVPVESLKPAQIDKIKIMAEKRGLEPEITDNVENAGWVVGVESGPLYRASSLNIETSLISTGLGTQLFKTLFPNAEILEL